MPNTIITGIILSVGAIYDIKTHRIPNWWVAGATGIGLGVLWWLEGPDIHTGLRIFGWFLLRSMAVIVVFFPLFHCRMLGAGDIKLMAVICGFLGFARGSRAILFSFFIGAVLSLFKLLFQRSLFQRLTYLFAYIRRLILTKEVTPYHRPGRDGYQHTIPMGLCLFVGTLISWIQR